MRSRVPWTAAELGVLKSRTKRLEGVSVEGWYLEAEDSALDVWTVNNLGRGCPTPGEILIRDADANGLYGPRNLLPRLRGHS